jgi:cyclohexadienyl dehydratase
MPNFSLSISKRATPLGLLLLSVLLFLTIASFFPTASAEELSLLQARGVLRVGVSGDYQPFSLCSENLTECRGFDVDIARRVAADLGVRLELVRFRWPELRTDLAAGKFDMAMSGVTLRPERALTAAFTRPYVVAQAVVLIADRERFPSLAAVDQAGVRLAVNAGGHLEQVARTHFRAATVQPTAKNLSLPDLVVTEQADALLTDSLEAPHFLAASSSLSALPGFGRDRKVYLLRRTDTALRDWLDTWLIARETDGVMPMLRARWFGTETRSTPHLLSALFACLDLRLALMPAVADYKRRVNLSVTDQRQEQAVLEQIAAQAQAANLNEQSIQQLFRVQIELAKQVQQVFLQDQHGQLAFPAWARGLDLSTDLRPVLAELGNRIVLEFARVRTALPNQTSLLRMSEEEITTSVLSPTERRQLGKALWQSSQSRRR